MQTQLDGEPRHGRGRPGRRCRSRRRRSTAEPVSTRSTRDHRAAARAHRGGLRLPRGRRAQADPGPVRRDGARRARAIQVAPDRDFAAVRLATARSRGCRRRAEIAVVDTRAGLVDPGADPFGYIWSVPRDQPSEVAVFSAAGQRFAVADAWPGATQIVAMAVSRDGTRMAALIVTGGRPEVWIAGIVRDDDNVPVRLGEPVPLGARRLRERHRLARRHDGRRARPAWPAGPLFTEQLVGGPATRDRRAASALRRSPAPPRSRPCGCAPTTARCTSSAARTGSARRAASSSWRRSRARRSRPWRRLLPRCVSTGARAPTRPAPRPDGTRRADDVAVDACDDGSTRDAARRARRALALVLPVACAGCDEPDVALCEDVRRAAAPARRATRIAADRRLERAAPSTGVAARVMRALKEDGRTGLARDLAPALRPPSRRGAAAGRTVACSSSCPSRPRARRSGAAATGSSTSSRGAPGLRLRAPADVARPDRRPARPRPSTRAAATSRARFAPRGAAGRACRRRRRRRDDRRDPRRGGSSAARGRAPRWSGRRRSPPRRAATQRDRDAFANSQVTGRWRAG